MDKTPNRYHALIAFAIALAIAAFMFAVTGPNKARYASPDYWHYKHHWTPVFGGSNSNCDEKCKFMEGSEES